MASPTVITGPKLLVCPVKDFNSIIAVVRFMVGPTVVPYVPTLWFTTETKERTVVTLHERTLYRVFKLPSFSNNSVYTCNSLKFNFADQ